MRRRLFGLAALLALSTSLAPAPLACGYDGGPGDGFSALHPKSLDVALNIHDAIARGALSPAAAAPIVPGSDSYWAIIARLNALRGLLTAGAERMGARPALTVLFVESGLWTYFTPTATGYDMYPHQTGPAPGDTVVVTNGEVLSALLTQKIGAGAALDDAVIALDGPSATETRALLLTSLDPHTLAASAAPPIQFFPPRR